MLSVTYGESVRLMYVGLGLGIMGEGIRSGSKAMGGGILALIAMNIGAFSTHWIVLGSRILHPDEAHEGVGILHFDGHLVMRRPFVVALGFVAFAPA